VGEVLSAAPFCGTADFIQKLKRFGAAPGYFHHLREDYFGDGIRTPPTRAGPNLEMPLVGTINSVTVFVRVINK
jgi:hypothetical protein